MLGRKTGFGFEAAESETQNLWQEENKDGAKTCHEGIAARKNYCVLMAVPFAKLLFMGIRKRNLFVLLAMSSLASCSLPYMPMNPLTFPALKYNFESVADYRQCRLRELYIDNTDLVPLTAPMTESMLIKDKTTGKYGAILISTSETSIPFEYDLLDESEPSKSVVSTEVANYIVLAKNGLIHIFGERGDLLVDPFSNGLEWSIEGTRQKLEYGVQKQAIETIKVKDRDDVVQKINKDGTRSTVEYDVTKLLRDETGNLIPCRSNLASVALPNYDASVSNDGVFVTFRGGDQVASFTVPDYDFGCMFHKVIFSQKKVLVADGDPFDFSEGNQKYRIETKRTELVNGNTFDVGFQYLIEDIKPIFDEEDVANHAIVKVLPIKEKTIGSESKYLLINHEGAIINDFTGNPLYTDEIVGIDWNAYYTEEHGIFYNDNLDKVIEIPDVCGISYADKLFVTKDQSNQFGITKFNGIRVAGGLNYSWLDFTGGQTNKALAVKDGQPLVFNPTTLEETPIAIGEDECVSIPEKEEKTQQGVLLIHKENNPTAFTKMINSAGNTIELSVNLCFCEQGEIHTAYSDVFMISFYSKVARAKENSRYVYYFEMR